MGFRLLMRSFGCVPFTPFCDTGGALKHRALPQKTASDLCPKPSVSLDSACQSERASKRALGKACHKQ